MWLIVLEALAALGVLVFIVWWTMFSGRHEGELHQSPPSTGDSQGHSPGQDR